MQLRRYLEWLVDVVQSRRDIEIEDLRVRFTQPDKAALVSGRLRFWDGSLLEFTESVEQRGVLIDKVDYAYHFQDADSCLVFRYDDSPHHPEIDTHPHHKHVRMPGTQDERLEPASAPHLGDVLREVDRYLWSRS